MKLRTKTLVLIGAVVLIVVLPLLVISQFILLNSYADHEKAYTIRNVERALNVLHDDLADLNTSVADWAAWDETYNFIASADPQYIEANLMDETFTNLKVNLMVFLNSSGDVVAARAFDLERRVETLLPAGLEEHFNLANPLLIHEDTSGTEGGFIVLPESTLYLVSHPIVTSTNEGPVRGTLIMGRYLDSALLARLEEQMRLSISITKIQDAQLPDGVLEELTSAPENEQVLINALDDRLVAGYTLVEDLYGKPVMVVEINMPRDIYYQGLTTITYLEIILLISWIIMTLALILLLDRQVLSRLGHIIKDVTAIGTNGSLTKRVTSTGKDELTILAGSINTMLDNLAQSHSKLRESEERYRALVEIGTHLEEAILILQNVNSKEGVQTFFNDSWPTMTGYTHNELNNILFFDLLLPANREASLDRYRRRMRGELTMGFYEISIIRKDGTPLPVEATSTRTTYHGQIASLVFLRDISSRKKAEQELQRLYSEEKKLRLELEEEIKKRTEFTRALVHELKTPMTPVLASSELLLDEIKITDTSEIAGKHELWIDLAKNVFDGASNLNRRINELLDLARGEVGLLKLELQWIDALDILREIIGQTSALASHNKQQFKAELPASLPSICADEDRLRQILLNLIGNAMKYTPTGGTITVRARQEDSHLIVEIHDTGKGIDENEQVKLFQPYHRPNRDRERLSGLGLGLALSKRLVELHKGSIWVKSKRGEGSTFGFNLPIDPTKCQPPQKPQETR